MVVRGSVFINWGERVLLRFREIEISLLFRKSSSDLASEKPLTDRQTRVDSDLRFRLFAHARPDF